MRSRIVMGLSAIAALAGLASPVLAHEKWFHEGEQPPMRASHLTDPAVMIGIGVVIVATIVAALWWRMRKGRDLVPGPESFRATEESRAAFYSLVPAILGIHLAVPLLVNGVTGRLFSPNNELTGAWYYWLGLVQTAIALSFFYGGLTRVLAVVLAMLWVLCIYLFGLESSLDNIFYLGFAGFFYFAGRGPVAIDRLLFPSLEPSSQHMDKAMFCLRSGIGLSLIFVAFSEKLANLDLVSQFLQQRPLNFTGSLGIPMSDKTFAICGGTVELLVGVFLLLGLFPRVIILIAWLPFNLTLTIFNWVELIGHLPFYGALAVLLIWTPRPDDRRLFIEGLRGGPLDIASHTRKTSR